MGSPSGNSRQELWLTNGSWLTVNKWQLESVTSNHLLHPSEHRLAQPLPPLHDSPSSFQRGPPVTPREQGTPASSDAVNLARDEGTDVTLGRPLPLLSIAGYCSRELQLTDERASETRGRIPSKQRTSLEVVPQPVEPAQWPQCPRNTTVQTA